jgi:hypothetical protein
MFGARAPALPYDHAIGNPDDITRLREACTDALWPIGGGAGTVDGCASVGAEPTRRDDDKLPMSA